MRNANNYGEATGDSALSADVRAILFRDMDRLKSDMSDIDSRLSEALAESNSRTDIISRDIYDRIGSELRQLTSQYNALSTQLTATSTITTAHGSAIADMRNKISEIEVALAVSDGMENRVTARFSEQIDSLSRLVDSSVENRMLRQQNQDNLDLPRATLKDIPSKVSDIDKRLIQLERRMWLIQILGTLVSALALSFGKELFLAVFKH